MAGLQYNFFPRDFFYPRPTQSPSVDATPSPALNMQNQTEDQVVADESKPVIMVHQGKKTGVSLRWQGQKLGRIYMQNRGGEQVKLPQRSFSWLVLIPEEPSD